MKARISAVCLRADDRQERGGIDQSIAPGVRVRPFEIDRTHCLEELQGLGLETIGRPASACTREPELGRKIEQECQIGSQLALNQALEQCDARGIQSASAALIGVGRVGKAIAEHPDTGLERGTDRLGQMLGARREHEEQLGGLVHPGVLGIDEQTADPLGDG